MGRRRSPTSRGDLVLHRLVLVVAVVTATVGSGGTAVAQAVALRPVAVWELNEGRGARTMVDSSGHGLDGRVGAEVETGVDKDGATAYFFPRLQPNTPPPHPEHLVTVADNVALDPGDRTYAVTFRMITTHSFGNIIQKGQAGSAGGYFKFQAPNGIVQCLFRGSAGSGGTQSDRRLNDGKWHTIRCERSADAVTLTVDGTVVGRHRGWTGTIANAMPLSIGGKTHCDQVKVTCDYFPGYLDRVRIDAG